MTRAKKPAPLLLSATVKLLVPVEHDGKTYTELTMRRMKVADTLVAEGEKNEEKAGIMLFAALAGVPYEVMVNLDIEDFAEVGAAVVPLMGKRAAEMMKKMGGKQFPGGTSSSP